MKTEYRLAGALKSLMSEVPLDSISVTLLAKKCRVRRQTFYYHFHDIYDVLSLVFLNETIDHIEECKTLKQMVRAIFSYYDKNRDFLDATINSACKDLFQEFIHNNCYRCVFKFISNNPESKKITMNDKKSIARFYAMAFSNSIVYYLSTYKNKTLLGLETSLCFEDDDSLKSAVDKMIEHKSKK